MNRWQLALQFIHTRSGNVTREEVIARAGEVGTLVMRDIEDLVHADDQGKLSLNPDGLTELQSALTSP